VERLFTDLISEKAKSATQLSWLI